MPEFQTTKFRFFLADRDHPAAPGGKRWRRNLPLNRRGAPPCDASLTSVTYGDYFQAIGAFLARDDFEFIGTAAEAQGRRPPAPAQIRTIDVFAMKHGAFYHPARVEVTLADEPLPAMVLNVAIATAGRSCIENEYRQLKSLGQKEYGAYLPQVYAFGHGDTGRGRHWPMFLGQWLEGFYEFHLAQTGAPQGQYAMSVWDPRLGPVHLERQQVHELYRQVAVILTCLYDVETFAQVFPWHHAAGDFVVKPDGQAITVKLITIRRFAPLFETAADDATADARTILDGLLIFFLNLLLRMRLDRLDGVGDLVWADDTALLGAWDGFFAALATKPPPQALPFPLDEAFAYVLATTPKSDLHGLSLSMAQRIYSDTDDLSVINDNLARHIDALRDKVCGLGITAATA